MNKEFTRMQELAGISLNEATQIEADVEKWLEGYLKGTVLTSNDDFEKYGSQDDPKKIKYVVDGGFKKGGFLDVKYSYNKEYITIPQKDILDLAKKMGVEDSDSYKVENAVKNALNKKGFKQKLDFSMEGKETGEMMSQFFRDPNLKQPLDENFVGTQMVGNIFDREKEKYEDAFEHFLSERYEEKVEPKKEKEISKQDKINYILANTTEVSREYGWGIDDIYDMEDAGIDRIYNKISGIKPMDKVTEDEEKVEEGLNYEPYMEIIKANNLTIDEAEVYLNDEVEGLNDLTINTILEKLFPEEYLEEEISSKQLDSDNIKEDESEFERNTPFRINQFIKELDALIEEYHAELYLKDDVFTGIEAVKMAALGENTAQD